MANLGSNNTPISGESFDLPSGWSFEENADGEVVITDSGGATIGRRDETNGEWVFDSIVGDTLEAERIFNAESITDTYDTSPVDLRSDPDTGAVIQVQNTDNNGDNAARKSKLWAYDAEAQKRLFEWTIAETRDDGNTESSFYLPNDTYADSTGFIKTHNFVSLSGSIRSQFLEHTRLEVQNEEGKPAVIRVLDTDSSGSYLQFKSKVSGSADSGYTFRYEEDSDTLRLEKPGGHEFFRATDDLINWQFTEFQNTALKQPELQLESGTTSERPSSPNVGREFFDTDEGQPIWYDGDDWVDAQGSTV